MRFRRYSTVPANVEVGSSERHMVHAASFSEKLSISLDIGAYILVFGSTGTKRVN